MAVVAWVLRQLVGLAGRRRPVPSAAAARRRPGGYLDFASALAVLAGLGRLVEWVTSRAVWQGLSSGWHAFLGVLPDLRLPFDLTLPEALAELAGWLTRPLMPGVWSAVLLPLVWVALTAVVFGWREVGRPYGGRRHRGLARPRRPGRPHGEPVEAAVRLLHAGLAAAQRRPADQVPAGAARLPAAAGGWTVVPGRLPGRWRPRCETARTWAVLGVARLLGPRDPYVALAWSWAEDLATTLAFTTVAVALYAAAGRPGAGAGGQRGRNSSWYAPARPTVAPVTVSSSTTSAGTWKTQPTSKGTPSFAGSSRGARAGARRRGRATRSPRCRRCASCARRGRSRVTVAEHRLSGRRAGSRRSTVSTTRTSSAPAKALTRSPLDVRDARAA